jgi:hypothetical protein
MVNETQRICDEAVDVGSKVHSIMQQVRASQSKASNVWQQVRARRAMCIFALGAQSPGCGSSGPNQSSADPTDICGGWDPSAESDHSKSEQVSGVRASQWSQSKSGYASLLKSGYAWLLNGLHWLHWEPLTHLIAVNSPYCRYLTLLPLRAPTLAHAVSPPVRVNRFSIACTPNAVE